MRARRVAVRRGQVRERGRRPLHRRESRT
jgi:hypothetical protein